MMDCAEAQELRSLSLDGELDPTDAPRLKDHLAHCPVCGPAYAAEQALSALVKREARRFTAPASLQERIASDVARRGARRRFGELRLLGVGWNPVAIAASIMLAIVGTSYLQGGRGGEEDVAQAVVASHIRSLMANHLTDVVSSDQHTVKPWFNGRLDISPPVVDLAAAGFPLVGGRLDYLEKHPVAALVYRHQQHLINVMVWPTAAGKREPVGGFTQQGYNVIHFEKADLSYWVVSDLNPSELRDFVAKLTQATPDEDAKPGRS
jgi:anti-sigma factor (TIGR02949 family)